MRTKALLLLTLIPVLSLSAADPFEFGGDSLSSSFVAGQERTTLTGHARIVSGNLEIQADNIELWGPSFRYAQCVGTVKVLDRKKKMTIEADSMTYDRTLKTSRLLGQGELQDADHGVTVRAGLFDYDETSERVTIQTGVRIFKGNLVCRSDFAVYDRTADSLELTGLPEVTKKRDVYRAGSIRVNLKNEDVFLDGRVSGTIIPEKSSKKDGSAATSKDTSKETPPGPPPGAPGSPPP